MTRTDREWLADLRTAVTALYRSNRQQGYAAWCDCEYDFVCPSPGTYPFQWFWDSCLHAIVLSRLDPDAAATELRTLLANQHPDGFVSHVTFWQREEREGELAAYFIDWRTPWLTDSMQPPILADAVAAVAWRGAGASFLREVLPAVRAYYDWCQRVRDPAGDGLIVVFEPHETGMDQSPSFDAYVGVEDPTPEGFATAWRALARAHAAVHRDPRKMVELDRFVVADLLVNTLYADNQRILAGLLAETGDETGADELRRRAAKTTAALLERCWEEADGEFHALAGSGGDMLPGGTVAGLVPLLLEGLPDVAAERMVARLQDRAQFAAQFPVPSVARSHLAYRPRAVGNVLWRGPTWINTNWYVARGLHRRGRVDLARAIEDASLALVERSGFREYYNPETGTGYGARNFAWSALVLEMLAGRVEGDVLA
ncbi:MAG: amylo-alpha-1,6-glucosidase [Candidatus Limnocylindria bacterium]